MPRVYKTSQGDMWDDIAYKMYGHERYMNVLLEANYKHSDILVFPANIEIVVPDVAIAKAVITPPWKKV